MKFLEQAWFDAVNEKIKADDEFQASIANVSLAIQQHVTECPGGDDIFHYMLVRDGAAEVGLGEVADADATMKASYDSSAMMQRGEIDVMSAFSGGKLSVTGNMAVLMSHQGTLTMLNRSFDAVRDDTEFDT